MTGMADTEAIEAIKQVKYHACERSTPSMGRPADT